MSIWRIIIPPQHLCKVCLPTGWDRFTIGKTSMERHIHFPSTTNSSGLTQYVQRCEFATITLILWFPTAALSDTDIVFRTCIETLTPSTPSPALPCRSEHSSFLRSDNGAPSSLVYGALSTCTKCKFVNGTDWYLTESEEVINRTSRATDFM